MSKNKIPKIEQLSVETDDLFEVLNDKNNLSVILIGSSFLDTCLASILERHFINSSVSTKILDSRRGTLGSFTARADTCYVLGLITKPLYSDLLKIAEIRNEVAHYHLYLSFNSEEVKKKCSELSYVKALKNGKSEELLDLSKYMNDARGQFVMTVVMISQRLLLIGLETNNDS